MASMGKSRGWGQERRAGESVAGEGGLSWTGGLGANSSFVGFLGLFTETLVSRHQTLNPNFLPFSSASAIHPVP